MCIFLVVRLLDTKHRSQNTVKQERKGNACESSRTEALREVLKTFLGSHLIIENECLVATRITVQRQKKRAGRWED